MVNQYDINRIEAALNRVADAIERNTQAIDRNTQAIDRNTRASGQVAQPLRRIRDYIHDDIGLQIDRIATHLEAPPINPDELTGEEGP